MGPDGQFGMLVKKCPCTGAMICRPRGALPSGEVLRLYCSSKREWPREAGVVKLTVTYVRAFCVVGLCATADGSDNMFFFKWYNG